MVTPECPIDVQHAACDASSDSIFVEGEVVAGKAACLMPRRYRKQPDWWVVEVVAVDAPTEQPQQFRLACPAEGLWGTEGIEVIAASGSQRIPRPAPEPPPGKLGSGTRILRSSSPEASD